MNLQEALPVAAEAFKAAMRRLPAPVTVVTWQDEWNRPRGFTASSVLSLSLDPPLLLVCVSRTGSCHGVVAAPGFCVNLLGPGDEELARQFGTSDPDKFATVAIERLPSGVPSLARAPVRIGCRAYGSHDGGDHTIQLGLVTDTLLDNGEPLVWHDRRISRLVSRV